MIWAVTPIPLMNWVFLDSRAKLIFSKPPFDEISQGFQRIPGVFSLRLYRNSRPLRRSQHHQIQDAFPVGHLPVFFHLDFTPETAGGLHKGSRGPGVQAELILYHEDLGQSGFHIEGGK
jgi:hypothetical protein